MKNYVGSEEYVSYCICVWSNVEGRTEMGRDERKYAIYVSEGRGGELLKNTPSSWKGSFLLASVK